jgi:cytochrome c-type biogenesis protein CcmH/NrfG
MKSSIIALVVFCAVITGGSIFYCSRPASSPAPAKQAVESTPVRPMADASSPAAVVAETEPTKPQNPDDSRPVSVTPVSDEMKPAVSASSTSFSRAMDALVSKQSSFQEKQAALKQLRDASELDQAIAALKAGMADNPDDAVYPAALGEAYIYKLMTAKESGKYNELAILGLQADQSFDAALKLDPSHWDAQYYKAASLAHWPPEMNKGPEVIQRLSSLIDQQEAMPSQPQFAQTYVLLGEQYQKAGQPDYAVQTWKLGAARFPGDATLRKKTSGAP